MSGMQLSVSQNPWYFHEVHSETFGIGSYFSTKICLLIRQIRSITSYLDIAALQATVPGHARIGLKSPNFEIPM